MRDDTHDSETAWMEDGKEAEDIAKLMAEYPDVQKIHRKCLNILLPRMREVLGSHCSEADIVRSCVRYIDRCVLDESFLPERYPGEEPYYEDPVDGWGWRDPWFDDRMSEVTDTFEWHWLEKAPWYDALFILRGEQESSDAYQRFAQALEVDILGKGHAMRRGGWQGFDAASLVPVLEGMGAAYAEMPDHEKATVLSRFDEMAAAMRKHFAVIMLLTEDEDNQRRDFVAGRTTDAPDWGDWAARLVSVADPDDPKPVVPDGNQEN